MNQIEATRILSDEYSAKILIATYLRPKNAIELSQRLGIPMAACYRRIRTLERAGLLQCVGRSLTQKGKRISNYVSQLKDAQITLENGQLRVRFGLKSGTSWDFGGVWSPLDALVPNQQAG
ncbi:MAG: winged helix-turn-helix transcriptional regulator [Euryarchaeota archaeon]|nr:winged helix-turn-helix transcriptional regulator [Euryarchaeota archaeon]